MPVNFYQVLWIIVIYAFLGWCTEVGYAAMCDGKFVNRGFLNGPVCPIYGFGMLLVVTCLWRLRSNVLLLFIGSVILTSALEFVTGWILERFFREKWWDYSEFPFNIKGYICLKFSVLWGLAAAFVIGAVHPLIYLLIKKTPFTVGLILLCVFLAVIASDLVITVVELLKIPKRISALMELERLLNGISDSIGENISDGALALKEKNEELKNDLEEKKPQFEEKTAELREQLEKKRAEYAKLLKGRAVTRRITRAFPNLKIGGYKAVLERISTYSDSIREKLNDKR